MIIRITLAVLFTLLAASADDWLKEPALRLVLKIDGKDVAVTEGTEQELSGEFKNPKVTVRTAGVRTFDCAGIRFDYPAGYAWHAEGAEGRHCWTLAGPAVTVILTHCTASMEAADVADALTRQGKLKGVKTAIVETHGGHRFEGWKIATVISDIPMNFRVFSIPLAKGSCVMQVIDNPGGAKGDSAEFGTTLEMLGKTLRVTAKEAGRAKKS